MIYMLMVDEATDNQDKLIDLEKPQTVMPDLIKSYVKIKKFVQSQNAESADFLNDLSAEMDKEGFKASVSKLVGDYAVVRLEYRGLVTVPVKLTYKPASILMTDVEGLLARAFGQKQIHYHVNTVA